jgi:hypothetical protein
MEHSKLRERIKNILKEMSMSGGGTAGAAFSAGDGMNYATPKAFKKTGNIGPGPKATKNGVEDNYYVKKFGFKPVDRKKLAKQSKAVDYKNLWGKTYK